MKTPMNLPNISTLATQTIPTTRGVHSYDEVPSGRTVYYAVTSTGELLNGELRRRAPDETEGMVVREMWRDLNRQDPVTAPRRFALYVAGQLRP